MKNNIQVEEVKLAMKHAIAGPMGNFADYNELFTTPAESLTRHPIYPVRHARKKWRERHV
ncbi:hypothetical protein [Paenibacillus planticolens]|uniref:Uncharacterized protein n=1 Tax=Paenibacillus planticolens TaxID=2654976 RepID=A0ABX1ZYZ0_9BACL|nr:hypothetical protein [Paenibacillus planticolens]NOV03978.1 hypothetical protein [Paenibacillus planticolens]